MAPPLRSAEQIIAPPPGIDPGPWASKAHVLATTQWRNLYSPLSLPEFPNWPPIYRCYEDATHPCIGYNLWLWQSMATLVMR